MEGRLSSLKRGTYAGKAKGTISSGVVEGFNNKVKLTMRKSYGFRSQRIIQLALYHNLGALPEPNFTHEFWRGGKKETANWLSHWFLR